MTLFTELWSIASFRRSFRSLPEVASEHKELLLRVAQNAADPEMLAEGLGGDISIDERSRVRTALAALQALRQIRDHEGLEDLIRDVVDGLGADAERFVPLLRDLLYEDPEVTERHRVRAVERSALPVLVNMSVEVDFRAVPALDGQDGTGPKLVPVMIVRLEFDEHIAGSDAIVFQVSHERASELAGVLDKATELRETILNELPVSLLPARGITSGDDGS